MKAVRIQFKNKFGSTLTTGLIKKADLPKYAWMKKEYQDVKIIDNGEEY